MQIKIHFTFWMYLLCIGVLSSYAACASILVTLLVHECCHYAVSKIMGEQIDQLKLTPFGGIMVYKSGTVSSKGIKGILVYAAGPLGNYALLLTASLPIVQRGLNSDFLRFLIISNTSMLVLNLLPALPLDGGRIAFCIGYYFLPMAKLVSVLSVSGIALGLSGILLTIYGFISSQLFNCSLALVSLYLAFYAMQSKNTLYSENLCLLVHERLLPVSSPKKVHHYRVASHTNLIDLLPLLKQGICVHFLFSGADGRLLSLDETQFCLALMESPMSTIAQVYASISNTKEKSCET